MGVWERRKSVFDVSEAVCRGVFDTLFHVEFHGVENVPREGPVLLFPKHQAYRDIIYEGILIRTRTGRHAYWIMADYLPDLLGMYGAVKIKRPKDLNLQGLRKEMGEARERAKAYKKEGNTEAEGREREEVERIKRIFQDAKAEGEESIRDLREKLVEFYKDGEVVIVHPEGTRKGAWANMLPFLDTAVKLTLEIEDEFGIKVPVVPVGIEYRSPFGSRSERPSLYLPGAKAFVRAGKPHDVREDGLIDILYEDVKRLSGL
ncbi:1-acyl-sn-glycerol-3-phosphate acyltransferase [Candidatus Woesearchaeota archaeon]|nr:1-acyl-sn-glycerol-3-phosphate acyltransferase [Candidatus Woesearchaeota archaeon]